MHISEDKIELLALDPGNIDEIEKVQIEAHLKVCPLCYEYYITFKKTLEEINSNLEKPAELKDTELADRIFYGVRSDKKKFLGGNETNIQVYNGNYQVIQNEKSGFLAELKFFFRRRPILSSSFAIMTVAIIASLAFIIFKSTIKDDNPVYAETKSGILIVYNSSGEILWKKTVGNLPDRKLDQPLNYWYDKDRKTYFNIVDIDNDYKNEILLSGSKDNRLFAHDSLYCFDNRGILRWKTSAGKFINFGTERWKHTKWSITDFFTVKSFGKNQLIVIANDQTYAPLIISKINSMDGKIISSFYHCGWNFERRAKIFDINSDGNEEIILGLTNNAFRRAALLVLSPDKLNGFAPATDFFYPHNYYKGTELYYILFPISNFGQRYAIGYFFTVYEISIGEDGLTVNTNETPGNLNIEGSILYSFKRNLEVVSAIGSQEFNRKYDEEYKKGTFTEPRDLNYFKKLVDSVQYWDGDKFVNYHTMNKYYKLDSLPQNLP